MGEPLIGEAVDFMVESNFQIMALQETDIGVLARTSAHALCKAKRHKLILGVAEPRSRKARVGILSSLPIVPVQLQLDLASTRCAAGLVDVCLDGRSSKLLIVSFYGFANDAPSTKVALDEVYLALRRYGGLYLVLGDFNLERDEGGVRDLLMDGRMACLDDCFQGNALPKTGPTRARRIDYALANRGLVATSIVHKPGLGDHLVTAYTLDSITTFTGCSMPTRHIFAETTQEKIQQVFQQAWLGDIFEQHLEAGELTEAWSVLSRVAETALCCHTPSAIPRDARWDPVPPRRSQQARIGCQGHESKTLQMLRRLRARLRQLENEPHSTGLQRNILRSLPALRAAGMRLPFVEAHNLPDLWPSLELFIADLSSQESMARVVAWQHKTRDNPSAQIGWIKRRADATLESEKSPPLLREAPAAVHPVRFLAQQAAVWTDRWTRKPRTPEADAALTQVLSSVARPAFQQWQVKFTAENLKSACARMKSKAPGADQWPPERLLHLPLQWWQAAARLWSQVLQAIDEGVEEFLFQDITAFFDNAVRRSEIFDLACDFTCRPDKCKWASRSGTGHFESIAREHAYPHVHVLPFLGVQLDLQTGASALLRLDLRKAVHRLRALRVLDPAARDKFSLVRVLIFSMAFWCAGVALPTKDQLTQLRQEVNASFRGIFTEEVARVVRAELLDWGADPNFCADRAALRMAWRIQVAPVHQRSAAQQWPVLLHGAKEVLHRHGWQTQDGGALIRRQDLQGRWRYFRFGYDNFAVLDKWLREAHRAIAVNAAGRVSRSLHREGEHLARGLDLEAPSREARFDFQSHKAIHMSHVSNHVRRAAAVTGGSYWHFNPVTCASVSDADPRARCLCGLSKPSRAHLTWACSGTAHLRQGLRPPSHRAEERLLAVDVGEYPPPPPETNLHKYQQDIKEALCIAFNEAAACDVPSGNAEVLVATDGSSKFEVGSFSVVICNRGQHTVLAAGDSSEDQSSFRAECRAVAFVVQAACQLARDGVTGSLVMLVDCEAALTALEHPAQSALPILMREAKKDRDNAIRSGLAVISTWVPAHGHDALCAEALRDFQSYPDLKLSEQRTLYFWVVFVCYSGTAYFAEGHSAGKLPLLPAETFSGNPADWEQWSWNFKAHISMLETGAVTLLDRAELMNDEFTDDTLAVALDAGGGFVFQWRALPVSAVTLEGPRGFNKCDANGTADCFTEDVVYEDLLLGNSTIVQSREEFRELIRTHPVFVSAQACALLGLPPLDCKVKVDSISEDTTRNTVGVEWHVEVSGQPLLLGRGLSFMKICPKTGLIAKATDIAEAPWRAIGLFLAPFARSIRDISRLLRDWSFSSVIAVVLCAVLFLDRSSLDMLRDDIDTIDDFRNQLDQSLSPSAHADLKALLAEVVAGDKF
ncbi:hypothetical protein AK812_SmicGene31666 [Symbiodinium microadriaticum]|uniref:Endonuclease/exonuclease/phosphatase domain-containing protein n=1 Tax=Symbiodinium microadriaticum TaxID=2951 RepID=A0A1Q9CW85_SYMMI|nr:hypothetical protein AK812_SmicGene31666 [Symbiodinium microadriaticum]